MATINKTMSISQLYKIILSTEYQIEVKKTTILTLIKMAISDHTIFQFLLSKINWFCDTNIALLSLLPKILRAHRGLTKNAGKVGYNLLAEGLSINSVGNYVVDLFGEVVGSMQHQAGIVMECLKEGYPHRSCSMEMHIAYVEGLLKLSSKERILRFGILQMVIENLCLFDTEMKLGEKYVSKLIYIDEDVLDLGEECNQLALKYDAILSRLLGYLSQFGSQDRQLLLKELFVIFQQVILAIDNTKLIQTVIFYLAELSPDLSSVFVALLLLLVEEEWRERGRGMKRKFIGGLQYLRSYLNRSVMVEERKICKILGVLMGLLRSNIEKLESRDFSDINISNFAEENVYNMYMFETIMYLYWKYQLVILANKNLTYQYDTLLKLAEQKLHFTLFIDPVLLSAMEDERFEKMTRLDVWDGITTKCIEKFVPVFLPQSRKYIRMRQTSSSKRRRPNWSEQSTQFENVNCIFKKLVSQINSNGSIISINSQKIEI